MKYTKHGELYREILTLTRWDESLADSILDCCNIPDGKGIESMALLLGETTMRYKVNDVTGVTHSVSFVVRENEEPTLAYDAIAEEWDVMETGLVLCNYGIREPEPEPDPVEEPQDEKDEDIELYTYTKPQEERWGSYSIGYSPDIEGTNPHLSFSLRCHDPERRIVNVDVEVLDFNFHFDVMLPSSWSFSTCGYNAFHEAVSVFRNEVKRTRKGPKRDMGNLFFEHYWPEVALKAATLELEERATKKEDTNAGL